MGGINALSGPVRDKLMSGLASQSAPANPATSMDRTDPAESLLMDYQRIRRSLEVCKSHLPDGDPRLLLIGAMHGAVSRLLSRVELSDAVDVLLEQSYPLSSPHLKERLQASFSPPMAPGGGAPMGQRPGGPMGASPTGALLAPGGQPPAPSGPGVPAGPGADAPGAA